MAEFYVYLHRRKDDGLPFYVGKGKGDRAFQSKDRNKYWKHTKNKHGIVVEILEQDLNEEDAFTKEVTYISKFMESNPDTMTNLTAGGEGRSQPWQTERNKKLIISFIMATKSFPSRRSKDSNELHLGRLLQHYASPSDGLYDPEFAKAVRDLGYGKGRERQVEASKQQIRDFISTNGRLPTQTSEEERHLYAKVMYFASPNRGGFDPEFYEELRQYGFGKEVEQRKQAIRDFYTENGRLPQEKEELYKVLVSYCAPSSGAFDAEFRKEMEACGYGKRNPWTYRETRKPFK